MLDTAAVKRRISELGLSQAEVARACGMTQPHLSKILTGAVKPGRKATVALEGWVTGYTVPDTAGQLQRLAQRIEATTPDKRMHVMQFLEGLERLL
ncbi:MAG: helix-turn-helix transcriptional regulator [Brevundimonas sp.]|nr:helix-turn-helix transcriptional regulator [Brevundimonas sp.]